MIARRIGAVVAAAVAASAALTAAADAASASPLPQLTAQTLIIDRPDSGNGTPDPYWADDTFWRTLVITRTGGSPGHWTFTGRLSDGGFFTAIKGAQTPNQAAPYTGDVILSAAQGILEGYADFTFTASTLPAAADVARYENDHGAVPSDSTSAWYELAFPAGTVFGGPGIGAWGWTYVAIGKDGFEHWADTSANGYGDLPGDGNIAG